MILHHPKPKPEPWAQFGGNKPAWTRPFYAIEYLFDWTTYALSNWAFLETLEYLGSLSILIAVIFYFAESKNRVKQRHYQAWQVINTAQGKGGSGGRIEALQELHQDDVSLTGVDVENAYLYGVKLEHATVTRANFHNADARKAMLDAADLSDSDLRGANFASGSLRNANLRGSDMQDATFESANLDGANLSGTNLDGTDFTGADLRDIGWENIRSVKMTNLQGVKNAPTEFIKWALQNGAVQAPSK